MALTILTGLLELSLFAHFFPYFSMYLPFVKLNDTTFTIIVKTLGHVVKPCGETLSSIEIDNSNAWYYFTLRFGKILLYLQVVMFALAVRRRFKP